MCMENISNTAFYQDDDTCQWHTTRLMDLGYNVDEDNQFYSPSNLDNFINNPCPNKIALYHVPFPDETTWLDRFEKTYAVSNFNVVICSELHEATTNQLIALDRPKVAILACGHIEHNFQHAHVGRFMDWFIMPTHFYTHIKPNLLTEKLLPQANKPKMFDVLLGLHRGHRDFVYNYIKNSDIESRVIMTYFKDMHTVLRDQDANQFIFEPEMEIIPNRPLRWSIDSVMYYGHEKSISMVVPITLYNQTYYSLVAETNYFNHFNFYTEKIVKPLMAGRLFVVISGQYYLKNLRAMGYQTFSSVIDESYDEEPDQELRWTKALEQVRRLCEMDPMEVYSKINPIVEHNKNLILGKDWYREFSIELLALLQDHIS